MNPHVIIDKYYGHHPAARRLLETHSRLVADKALRIAERVPHLAPDLAFVEEAALLHDIGIIFTDAPELGCRGDLPYLCHGILGRKVLEEEGLMPHALVCERHVGAGIAIEDIRRRKLPLPERDMLPLSIEEKIIGYADKFYSKNGSGAGKEKTIATVLENLVPFGKDQVQRFREWVALFEGR